MSARRMVRSEHWWDPKVAPLVGLAALAIGAAPGPAPAAAIGDLVLLLLSMIGVAAFGHLVNDQCDIAADAAGGKPNQMASLSPPVRAVAIGGALVLGLAPWWWLAVPRSALAALGVEVLLLIVYSVPPFRLKARGGLGAAADAAYAYAVPFTVVVLALAPRGDGFAARVVVLGVFGFVLGLRGILWHQVTDAEADRLAEVGTLARRLGLARTEQLVAGVLLPVELVLLVALIATAGVTWVPVFAAVFVVYRTFQVTFLWSDAVVMSSLRVPRRRVEILGFEYSNVFIERWLPIAALVALAVASPWWWLAVAACALVFHNALRTFLLWDIWVLPDGLERLAYARRARRDIAVVAQQRAARIAAGPDPLADPSLRRFVFVVCGPQSHIETLGTALDHLRPVTDAEIWVLTDSTRNAVPIEHDGIDHLVDVAPPAALDDHQASIWLKTSVHRHLPVGEWCYLDSDIIAVSPGVEGVFDERQGPVAFASDVTIQENSVDRFSPWAMTCDCMGVDHEHSCGHLREQLGARFGLDVPGDWLHWNGGVFVFGPTAAPVLDLWHERAVASFDWPEWKTRDQGALIATVWTLGLQDLPRLSPVFNFIADLGNHDLCLSVERGWAHHPAGPWYQARLLHLYTSPLEDPAWDIGRDVEAVVLRRSRVRISHHRRGEAQERIELLVLKARRFPRRLTPERFARTVRRRLGGDVSDLPLPSSIDVGSSSTDRPSGTTGRRPGRRR